MSQTKHDYGSVEARDLFLEITRNGSVTLVLIVAMERLNNYMAGARTQMERIWSNLELAKSRGEGWESAHFQAYIDIHFYLICWDSILKMILFVKEWSKFSAPNKVFKRHRKELERYREARDHLEHFEDRLLGRKKNKTNLARPAHLGNLDSSGMYYFGGEGYDVSPKSLELLEQVVAELNVELWEEANEKLAKIKKHDSTDAVV